MPISFINPNEGIIQICWPSLVNNVKSSIESTHRYILLYNNLLYKRIIYNKESCQIKSNLLIYIHTLPKNINHNSI